MVLKLTSISDQQQFLCSVESPQFGPGDIVGLARVLRRMAGIGGLIGKASSEDYHLPINSNP